MIYFLFVFVGDSVAGSYSVKEPSGAIRTVTYKADKDGFHAVVHTGKNLHFGGTYGAHNQLQSHQLQPQNHVAEQPEQAEEGEEEEESRYQFSPHDPYAPS